MNKKSVRRSINPAKQLFLQKNVLNHSIVAKNIIFNETKIYFIYH